ncbi:MAG: hypothetical protein KTR31_35330 [Myxococcales bacterium]|nr:hypothetical protein [Myxococcales bacterium]
MRPSALSDAAAAVGLGAFAFVGSGFVNGDAAAYVAQGWAADPWDRVVHLGYVALAIGLAPLAGDALPTVLDGVGVLATVALAGVWGRRIGGRDGAVAALGVVAAMLPWCAFAEVDPVWIAAVGLSAAGVPAAMGCAVAVSPVALLALPWVSRTRGRGPVLEAVLAVVVLSVVSGGDWWVGDRGVLAARPWLLGRTLQAWLWAAPWAMLAAASLRPRSLWPLLGLVGLCLVPPDVPAYALGGVAVAIQLGRARLGSVAAVAVAVQLVVASHHAAERAATVRAEMSVIRHVAASMTPTDGLVAPFTWGARVAVVASEHPYGVVWRPRRGWLRDQRRTWDRARPSRLVHLPPGHGSGDLDERGVRWERVSAP